MLGKRLCERTYTRTYLNNNIIGAYIGCRNYFVKYMLVYKKILTEILFKRKVIVLYYCLCFRG